MSSGITSSTLRTIVESLASDASDGYGEEASGTAIIQATSSTEATPSTLPTPASTWRPELRTKRARTMPPAQMPSSCPRIARTSTHTRATGTCARPCATRDPIGSASCAPANAPRKNPSRDSTPTTAPLRKPVNP